MSIKNDTSEPTLVCDLDGTLIKEDLERSFMAYLLRTKRLKWRAMAVAAVLTPANLICKQLECGSLWKVWLMGLTQDELDSSLREFLASWRYTTCNPVLQCVQDFKGKKILLTGSFEPLAVRWLEHARLTGLFDEVIGCRVFQDSIRVERHPFGRSKLRCLGQLKPVVALGNEYADRHLLGISQTAVCVGAADSRLAGSLRGHPRRETI